MESNLPTLQKVISHYLDENENLFAMIDAARDANLAMTPKYIHEIETLTLFEGEYADYVVEVAPHFVQVPLDSKYLDLWAERLGTSAGILLISDMEFHELRQHLRYIFKVEDEEGNPLLFRYYDPRVIRVYLPTCTLSDLREFFGPVSKFLVESTEPDKLLIYQATSEELLTQEVDLKHFDPESTYTLPEKKEDEKKSLFSKFRK